MLRLLAFLWTGCWHKWRPVRRVQYFGDGFGRPTARPTAFAFEYECERCGRVKEFRT